MDYIAYKRKAQIEEEKEAIEKFIKEQCEIEIDIV